MDSNELTHQQKRFCDEYLVSFNAFRSAMLAGYSENTARKAELLHLPKIQDYLKAAMNKTASRLQITHDMILRELAKVAFASMGDYYDERAVLKPMSELTDDQKAAISQYQILDTIDDDGYRIGELSKIKLHNKMSALDKIARHLNFYGVGVEKSVEKKQESGGKNQDEVLDSPEMGDLSFESEALSSEVLNEDVYGDGNMEEAKGIQLENAATAPSSAFSVAGVYLGMPDTINEAGPPLEDPALIAVKILTLSPLGERDLQSVL
jgi:phage terminase small subunit